MASEFFPTRRTMIAGSIGAGLAASPLHAFAQSAPASPNASGAAEITVDQAHTAPIPIAIPSFGPRHRRPDHPGDR